MATTGARRTISDSHGNPVAAFLPRVRDGRSWAEGRQPLGASPAGPIVDQLAG